MQQQPVLHPIALPHPPALNSISAQGTKIASCVSGFASPFLYLVLVSNFQHTAWAPEQTPSKNFKVRPDIEAQLGTNLESPFERMSV